MNNLAYGKTKSCFVFVSSTGEMDDNDWDGYCDFIERTLVVTPVTLSLSVSFGAAPSSRQRQKLSTVLKPISDRARAAVVTSSAMGRGIVTAMSWFVPGFRAFSPNEIDQALAYLKLPTDEIGEVKSLVGSLRAKLRV